MRALYFSKRWKYFLRAYILSSFELKITDFFSRTVPNRGSPQIHVFFLGCRRSREMVAEFIDKDVSVKIPSNSGLRSSSKHIAIHRFVRMRLSLLNKHYLRLLRKYQILHQSSSAHKKMAIFSWHIN